MHGWMPYLLSIILAAGVDTFVAAGNASILVATEVRISSRLDTTICSYDR